jgi:hypothetical protein
LRFLFLLLTETGKDGGATPPPGYSETLRRAGVLLASGRLHESSERLTVGDGNAQPVVRPHPAAEPVASGYWLVEVRTHHEALEWAKRCPLTAGTALEVRQVVD